jgi:hypothetical protein
MMPSDRIHEALMGFKAQQLLREAHNRESLLAEPRPVVVIVEENLVALSSAVVDSPSKVEDMPSPPQRADRRINGRLWATTVGIAGVLAILASAAPFSPPVRKGTVQKVSTQSPESSISAASALIQAPVTSNGQRRASLKIVETSWVSACADGKQIFAELFTTNEAREFWFSSRAMVRVGNASGVEFALDGVSLGPFGGHARLRRIEIDPRGLRVVPVKPSDGDRDC